MHIVLIAPSGPSACTLTQRAEDATVSPRPGIRGEGISKSPLGRGAA